ncbi:hypothetical protein DYB36_010893 [Aphanomyces astaci]|nr:hypothetical protein DYB36_010893 [Aphanomyces astaci]
MIEARRARRRHRSKINQRKYRAWQRTANNQLQHDVNELQIHTKRLESHVLALYNGERFHAEESSVQEYFRLFSAGFDRSERQLTFLRFFFTPNVWCLGQHGGVDKVIDLWERITATFASLRVEYQHITGMFSLADEVSIQAKVLAHLKMAPSAMDVVFPNVVMRRPDLARKLKGQVLVLPLHVTFIFDATKRVVRVDVDADVFSALLAHLESVHDVAVALDGANFRLDAMHHNKKEHGVP